jgi:short-subunit dehydrogenase
MTHGMKIFSGQTAVITGASSGIGKAIALGLAREGANLCLVGRKLDALEEVAENARRTGNQVQNYRADLAVEEDIKWLTQSLLQDLGHIDLLVHCAGVCSLGELQAVPIKDFDWQYWINVRAPYALTQALLPVLKPVKGQIVFLNSSVGLNAKAGIGQYAATKHALKAIADSLREEVNPEGLRVLSVFLGRTASPMQAAIHEIEGREYHPERLMKPEDVASVVIHALSLPRSAEVTDVVVRPLAKLND